MFSFEWDQKKAKANLKKHRVSFSEAATVFLDPLAMIFPDIDHSDDETREIITGESNSGRLLIVSYTERNRNIRIISSRIATTTERNDYENN